MCVTDVAGVSGETAEKSVSIAICPLSSVFGTVYSRDVVLLCPLCGSPINTSACIYVSNVYPCVSMYQCICCMHAFMHVLCIISRRIVLAKLPALFDIGRVYIDVSPPSVPGFVVFPPPLSVPVMMG